MDLQQQEELRRRARELFEARSAQLDALKQRLLAERCSSLFWLNCRVAHMKTPQQYSRKWEI